MATKKKAAAAKNAPAKKPQPPSPMDPGTIPGAEPHSLAINYVRLPNGAFVYKGYACSERECSFEELEALMDLANAVMGFSKVSSRSTQARQVAHERAILDKIRAEGGGQ